MKNIGLRQLIWKNLRRRMFRNIATIICFAFVAGSILSANFLIGGAQNSVNAGMSKMGADLLVVPEKFQAQTEAVLLVGQPTMFFFGSSVLDEVKAMPGVEKASSQLFIATLSNASCCSLPVQLIGFNESNDFTVKPWLSAELGRPLARDELLVGGLIIGDINTHLMFYGHDFVIAGRLDQTGMGIDTAIFIREQDALVMAEESPYKAIETLNVTSGMISAVLVKLAPGTNPESMAETITMAVPGTTVISANYLSRQVTSQLSGTTQALLLTTLSVTLVTIPLVAIVSSMVANERKREIGLLRAMGASKRFVFSLIMVEAIILAVIGASLGALAIIVLMGNFQGLITAGLHIPFLWPSVGVIIAQALTVCLLAAAIGGLAALYPALRSGSMEPYNAIRTGEL